MRNVKLFEIAFSLCITLNEQAYLKEKRFNLLSSAIFHSIEIIAQSDGLVSFLNSCLAYYNLVL